MGVSVVTGASLLTTLKGGGISVAASVGLIVSVSGFTVGNRHEAHAATFEEGGVVLTVKGCGVVDVVVAPIGVLA